MSRRILAGDKLWRSDKLRQVQPESYRAEYANMFPLALANGAFECSPERIWHEVYAFNRESFKPGKIAKILDEFERVKLLFRWVSEDGKTWGYWVGIDEKGLLPTKKQIKSCRYKVGETVPKELLKLFITNNISPHASQRASNMQLVVADDVQRLGLGVGVGSGIGEGSGAGEGFAASSTNKQII